MPSFAHVCERVCITEHADIGAVGADMACLLGTGGTVAAAWAVAVGCFVAWLALLICCALLQVSVRVCVCVRNDGFIHGLC